MKMSEDTVTGPDVTKDEELIELKHRFPAGTVVQYKGDLARTFVVRQVHTTIAGRPYLRCSYSNRFTDNINETTFFSEELILPPAPGTVVERGTPEKTQRDWLRRGGMDIR